jgi:hypothetical protein
VRLKRGASGIGGSGDVEFSEEELRAVQFGSSRAAFVVVGSFEQEPEGLCEGMVVGRGHGRADGRRERNANHWRG